MWLLTRHLCLCRVLTGSTGRATSTPSSSQRWSWDPQASEIWKEDESERKALGWWKGYRQGNGGEGQRTGGVGESSGITGVEGCEELVVVPKHWWPLAQQRLLQQSNQQALHAPAFPAEQLLLPTSNVLHAKDSDLKGCMFFVNFSFLSLWDEVLPRSDYLLGGPG